MVEWPFFILVIVKIVLLFYNRIIPLTKSPSEFKNPNPSLGASLSPVDMSYMSSTINQLGDI
jgi:hypothetical protein